MYRKIGIILLIFLLSSSNVFASIILKDKNAVINNEKLNDENGTVDNNDVDEKFINIKEKFKNTTDKLYKEFMKEYDLKIDKTEKDDIYVEYINEINEVYGAMPSQIFSIVLNYKVSHEKTDVWNMEIKKIYEEIIKKINIYAGKETKND